ncbi:ATP-binding protein [Acanthopleuribacter pedis]|uniref:ATP-binding protein n=1 Tax=Acanthopleuribacter pedis TaxID=442870 RepID=A0A8J7U4H8_9BACT|nr:ATP-binding protein [Acanthopleuribacter pedis]MBO1319453.1 ATP-binding protein [Acanthopleuribacter pedis]
MSNVSENQILIDVSYSRDAHSDSDTPNVIHQEGLRNIQDLLKQTIEKNQRFDEQDTSGRNNIEYVRVHDAILLSGGRGSGKTTLLFSIFRMLREDKLWEVDKAGIGKDIEPVAIFDPTLFEKRSNILVNIIARIKEKVDNSRGHVTRSEDYEAWKQSLSKLAKGLRLLDGVGNDPLQGDQWDDDQYVLSKGLEAALHGDRLEIHFNKFLDKSLDLLRKKYFFLAFDDIDTAFDKGWEVLETLRKYLTHPRLIKIIAGDISLFSTLVRKKQFENFEKDFLAFEGPERVRKEVDHLEEQYLVKILKPENRVELKTLWWYYANQYAINIRFFKSDSQTESVESVFRRFCESELGVFLEGDQRIVIEIFLALPARSFIQVMRAIAEKRAPSAQHGVAKALGQRLQEEQLVNRISSIFFSVLARFGFNQDDMERLYGAVGYSIILRKLIDADLFLNGWHLYPDFVDREQNLLMICLAMHCEVYLRRHPGAIFDYWLRMGLLHEIYYRNPHLKSQPEGKEAIKEKLNSIAEFLVLEAGGSSQAIARKISSFVLTHRLAYFGTLRVYSDSRRKRKADSLIVKMYGDLSIASFPHNLNSDADKWFELFGATRNCSIFPFYWKVAGVFNGKNKQRIKWSRYVNTFASLNEVVDGWNSSFVNLPFVNVHEAQGSIVPVASLYNSLGVISGLSVGHGTVDLFLRDLSVFSELKSYSGFMVQGQLEQEESSEQVIPDPAGEDEGPPESATEEAARSSEASDDDTSEIFYDCMQAWVLALNQLEHFNMGFLSKVWVRLIRSLIQVDSKFLETKDPRFLGDYLHRGIVSFLNAVYIESVVHGFGSHRKDSLSSNYPNDVLFFSNLTHALLPENNERFVLLKTLFRCPLWGFYLRPRWGFDKHQIEHKFQKQTLKSLDGISEKYIENLGALLTDNEEYVPKGDYEGSSATLKKRLMAMYDIPYHIHMGYGHFRTTQIHCHHLLNSVALPQSSSQSEYETPVISV